jgi:putative transposase
MMVDDTLERLYLALEQDALLVDSAVQRVRDEIAAYELVPMHEIVASLERNRLRAVRTLREGAVPVEFEIWEAEKTTLERLEEGVPIEDTMAGFRVSISTIQHRLVDLAAELDVPDREVVRLTRLLWELSDVFSSKATATYRRFGLARELAQQRRRDEWLLILLTGSDDEEGIVRAANALGLNPSSSYVALSIRTSEESPPDSVQRLLLGDRREDTCLLVPHGARLVGVASRVPDDAAGFVVAAGPPALPDQLHQSFSTAERVLDAAGVVVGIHAVESLGWRLIGGEDPDLGPLLERRYAAPLREARGAEEPLLDAVEAFLQHDLSIPRAAAALHVHVNTLRYRLARFESLTSRSLHERDTVVEMSWFLLRRRTPSVS